MTLLLILAACLTGGALTVLLAGTLLGDGPRQERVLPRLVSFSTGALLGAATLGMIPHAARALPVPVVTRWTLAGLLLFFLLEKLLLWRHCHRPDCTVHASTGPLLLIGDSFHNFVDGVVLAGAFLTSTPLGLAAALSTIAHELPQELGEHAIYRRSGYSRRRALLLNSASSLTAVLGGLVGYFFLSAMQAAGPYLLALAAAGFLYVALADLIPAQRGKTSLALSLLDLLLVGAGILVIAVLRHGMSG